MATYRGGRVTVDEYQSWLHYRKREDRPKNRLLEMRWMVPIKVLSAQAEAAGLDRDPDLAFQMDHGRDRILAWAYRDHVRASVELTEAEIAEAHRDWPEQEFHTPRQMLLSNLFKRLPPGASRARKETVRERMEELRARLLQGEDFAELARRESDSSTADKGGVVGYVQAGTLRPEVDRAASRLAAGEISPMIETADGLMLLKCDEIVPAWDATAQERLEIVARGLRKSSGESAWAETVVALREELAPSLDPEVLASRDPSAVLLRFDGGELTLHRLQLIARAPGAPDEKLRQEADTYITFTGAARRARRIGLDRDPVVRDRITWRRRERLMVEVIGQRVAARFTEPSAAEIQAHYEENRAAFETPEMAAAALRGLRGSEIDREVRAEVLADLDIRLAE